MGRLKSAPLLPFQRLCLFNVCDGYGGGGKRAALEPPASQARQASAPAGGRFGRRRQAPIPAGRARRCIANTSFYSRPPTGLAVEPIRTERGCAAPQEMASLPETYCSSCSAKTAAPELAAPELLAPALEPAAQVAEAPDLGKACY